MIRLQVLKLVLWRTEERTDERTDAGWTDGRGSQNSYLDIMEFFNKIIFTLKVDFNNQMKIRVGNYTFTHKDSESLEENWSYRFLKSNLS